MTNIVPFSFENHTVRVRDQDGEPWFVLSDVCSVLGLGNPSQTATRLDDDEWGISTNDTPSGRQEMLVVNESGLWSLVLTSRKPAAKRFKKWVTSEVIPSIRKTGGYAVASQSPRIDVVRESRLTMNLNLKLAKMAGLAGNQALLAANRATTIMTGIDSLRLLGVTHIDAPQNEALMTPTDLGKRFGLGSARAVNVLLCQLGLQSAYRDAKGHLQYEPTEIGKRAGGVMQDTGKSHGTGTPVRQLRWPSSVGTMLLNDNSNNEHIA